MIPSKLHIPSLHISPLINGILLWRVVVTYINRPVFTPLHSAKALFCMEMGPPLTIQPQYRLSSCDYCSPSKSSPLTTHCNQFQGWMPAPRPDAPHTYCTSMQCRFPPFVPSENRETKNTHTLTHTHARESSTLENVIFSLTIMSHFSPRQFVEQVDTTVVVNLAQGLRREKKKNRYWQTVMNSASQCLTQHWYLLVGAVSNKAGRGDKWVYKWA